MILPRVRDPRLVTVRRGGSLSDEHHHLLALWAADCAEHVDSPLVAPAFERRAEEGADAIAGDLEPDYPAAQRQDVRVVVLAAQARHGVVRAQGRPDRGKPVGGN